MSMYPLIRKGDFLTVRPTTFSQIQVGDVAVYGIGRTEEDTLTAHRVVSKGWEAGRPFLIIRSDAEGWIGGSAPVFSDQVYGKVIKIESEMKTIDLVSWRFRFTSYCQVRFVRGWALLKYAFRSPHRIPRFFSSRLKGFFQKTFFQKEERYDFFFLEDQSLLIPILHGMADMERVFKLSSTGKRTWELLQEKTPLEKIQEVLTGEFDESPERIQADLERFLKDLKQAGIPLPIRPTRVPLAAGRFGAPSERRETQPAGRSE